MQTIKFIKKRLREARNHNEIKSYDALIEDGSEKGRFNIKLRQFKNYLKKEEMPFDKLCLIAKYLDVSIDYLCGKIGKDGEADKHPFSNEIEYQVSKEKIILMLKNGKPIHDAIYGAMDEWLITCGIPKTELENLQKKSFRKPNEKKIHPYEELRGRLFDITLKTYNDVLFELGLDDIRVK